MLVIDVHRHHIWAGLMTAFLLQCLIATFQYVRVSPQGGGFQARFGLIPQVLCLKYVPFFLPVEYFIYVLSEVEGKHRCCTT